MAKKKSYRDVVLQSGFLMPLAFDEQSQALRDARAQDRRREWAAAHELPLPRPRQSRVRAQRAGTEPLRRGRRKNRWV